MTPILYEKDEIDFTSQGLGSLVEIYDVDVPEQRNGLFQLTAKYPVTGVRYDDIYVGRIILAKPNQRDEPHAFRIVNTELDVMGYSLMIEADSITYDLNHNIVKHLNVSSADGQTMMSALKNAIVNPSIFNFYSDINHVSSTTLDYVNPMEAIMGVKGSFLQIWGGELKRENRRVAMFNRRGRDNVATFRLGKNISGLKYTVDISSLITQIIPIKSIQENSTTTYLEGTPVNSQYINNYEQVYAIKVDFTDDTIKTVDDLNNAAAKWFVESANTGRDKPSVAIDIDVLSLQDSADYQDKFKDLESVALTDTVTVYVPEYGVNVTAIVNELHFDPIQERVTKLVVGTAKQSFADSSRVQLSDLQDKVTSVQEQADQIAVSANGKNTNYYGSVAPSHPQEGDLWYWKNGDLSGIKQFINGEWVDWVDSATEQKISDSVDKAVTDAKTYSDQAIATNREQVDAEIKTVSDKTAQLETEQAELDTKAQGYANQALADAKADTLATATQTAKDASDALAKAKTDLTTSLNKEVTDRANAVTALDTKAKGYATQAKADAIATANGAVAKEVTDRQKAITDLDAKSTGAINQAKTDAQSALDALQVGGRNWLLNSKATHSVVGNNTTNQVPASLNWTFAGGINSGTMLSSWGIGAPITISYDWTVTGSTVAGTFIPQFYPQPYSAFGQKITVSSTNTSGHYVGTTTNISASWAGTTASTMSFRLDGFQGTLNISNFKLEIGNKATDYTQAPEDVVLDYTTKDNVISQSLTQYQATNDGKVTKAQSDATQALGLVATKVSQTDYNTKTGDLYSKYTAVKQTADQATTDIVAIKSTNTSQDTKINTLTSDVDGTKQSISDIQTEQGAQSTKINTIQTDVSGTKQDISDIKDANGVQDGKIASISTTVDGLSSSFSTYKTTNDGKVAKAQADITANSTAISQKVSQTAYDAKTGQLQTDLNTTTTTANQAKTDIVAIKKTNTDQDTRMTTIESDANGTKTTVSNLQTDLGKANGSISTLQQRADGFDATVTKVNNLSVGGRNLLLHTNTNSYSTLNSGNGQYTTKYVPFDGGYKYQFTYTTASTNWAVYQFWGFVKEKYEPDTDYVLSFMANFSVPVTPRVLFANGASGNNFIQQKTTPTVPSGSDQRVVIQLHTNATIPTASDQSLYMGNFQRGGAGTFTIWDLKIEKGNLASSYTPAPEDVDSATARAQLTADQATTSLNNYKTDADGRISKAQADIIVNANAITQKVSQSDYNAKTGDLTTKVNTAQSTADSATSTIGAYKTSNDARVASAESKITANANAITQKVSQSDYNTKTGQLDAQISTINQTATGISQSVSSVQAQANTNTTNISTVSQTVDSISSIVSDPTTGLTKRVQTAEGTLSQVTGADIPALQKATYWQAPNGYDLNTYLTQGSFFFRDTTARTNSPTTRTDWMYLVVERGLSSRVTQVAWYDQLNDAKISYKRQYTGTWSPWYANDNDSVTTISQTNGTITQEISDRKTGDNNTLQSSKDFTVSSISSSEQGMKSLISQKADSVIVGTISDSVDQLKSVTNWQQISYDDLNFLKQTGNYLITQSANTNFPPGVTAWAYVKVEAPRSDRVTQRVWKDLNATQSYVRTFDGTNWSVWSQQVTSSTLLSIFKDSWSLGTSVNGDIGAQITSGIVANSDSMSLISKNIVLDGNTTVTGDFYAKGGNFKNLNASNLTVGTLNGSQVNITNINANNIVSGAISGANLNINLNTGQVVFQRGRIYNSLLDQIGGIDINVDSRYISVSNSDTKVLIKGGEIGFVEPTVLDLNTTPYLKISNTFSGSSFYGATFNGRDYAVLTNDANKGNLLTVPLGVETFSGVSTGKPVGWEPTKVGGADRGVIISGGSQTNMGFINSGSPYVFVGSDSSGNHWYGDRVVIRSSYTHLPSSYNRVTSNGANVFIAGDGALVRSSSSSKYKLDIEYEQQAETANRLLTLDPATWHDKFESEQLDKFHEIGVDPERAIDMSNRRYYGIIAEDLVNAGLEHLVSRNVETGEVEGVEYSKIGLALIPIIRDLRNRLNDQYVEIERLKEKIK